MPDTIAAGQYQTIVAVLQNMVVAVGNLTKGLAGFTPAQVSSNPNMAIPAWLTPNPQQKLTHIAAAGNYQIHSEPCILWGFSLNNAVNRATMNVYDGIGGGTLLGAFDVAVSEVSFILPGGGWFCRTGLYVTVSQTPDLTFVSASQSGN